MNDLSKWLISIPGAGLLAVMFIAVLETKPRDAKPAAPDVVADTAETRGKGGGPSTPEDHLIQTAVLQRYWSLPFFPGILAPADKQHVEFLVVTLPDPVGSQLGYVFDQGTDAIIRAGTSARFVFEGHWFPWEVWGEGKEPARRGKPSEHPGVLVFRHRDNIDHRLVVLIVGEDPVTGVRPRALDLAFRLAVTTDKNQRPMIRVVGPMYSGSQASLARAMRAQDRGDPGPQFRVYSGSATGLKLWAELFGEKAEPGRYEWPDSLCGEILVTTIPVKVQRQAVLHHLTRPGWVKTDQPLSDRPKGVGVDSYPRYASLSETNTAYGGVLSEWSDKGGPKERQLEPVGSEPTGWPPEPVIRLRFPMHISRMAGVLAKEQRSRDERLGFHTPGRVSLAALDAGRSGGDLLPAGDEARTAAVNMERLDHFWEMIRRERIRYVEIVATDSRDRLFLIQLLREHCPNVVPFTYGMDLLFGHPDYLPFTRGTVVATTYPLRPAHQDWTNKPGRRNVFALNAVQGTYNAILAQLGKADRMIDYAPPAVPDAAVPPVWVTAVGENGNPIPLAYFSSYDTTPMLQRGSSPASGEGKAPGPGATAGRSGSDYIPHRSGLRYLALAVIAGGVAVGELIRRAGGRAGRLRPLTAGLYNLYGTLALTGVSFAAIPPLVYYLCLSGAVSGPGGLAWQDGCVMFGLAVVAVAAALMSIVLAFPALAAVLTWVFHQTVAAGGWCLRRVAGEGTSDPSPTAPPPAPDPAVMPTQTDGRPVDPPIAEHQAGAAPVCEVSDDRPVGVWVVTGLAVVAYVILLTYLVADLVALQADPGRRWLFVERAADTDAGASPLLPAVAFAAGFGLYGAAGLLIVRELARHRIPCPFPVAGDGDSLADDPATARFRRAAAEVPDRGAVLDRSLGGPEWVLLEPPVRGTGWCDLVRRSRVRLGGVCLVGLALGLCYVLWLRAHPTWEGGGWNALFLSGFVGLTLLTALAAFRLYLGWKGVERLTGAILGVPMAGAFDRFPDKIGRLFGRYLLASRRRLRDRDVLLYLRDQAVRSVEKAGEGRAAGPGESPTTLSAPFPPAIRPDAQAIRTLAAYQGWVDTETQLAAARKKAETEAVDKTTRSLWARWTAPAPPPPRESDARLAEDDVADLCRLSEQLVRCLIPVWAADGRSAGAAFGTVPVEAGKESPEPDGWVARGEQFVAVMAVVYLSQYLVRMRRLAVMTAAAAGALLTAVTTYQFQPERPIMTAGLVVAVGVALLILWVLTEINRNELVSRVCRSTPNRFSLDAAFVSNVATLVLPLVLVIAAQFAGRTRAVVEPVLGWFR